MRQLVCVLGVPRTGSTRVISILSGFEDICARGEIFQLREIRLPPDEAAALASSAGFGTLSSESEVKHFISWLRHHPNAAIDWLQTKHPDRTLVFKLLGGQIADETELRRLFARGDIRFLVVRRRPIDAYISLLKVRATKAVHGVVTTEVKVEGNVEQFLWQWGRYKEWYSRCSQMITAAKRPHLDVSYQGEVVQSDEQLAEVLRTKLKVLGVDSGRFNGVADRPVTRQDFATSYNEKMSNWPAFAAALRTRPEQFDAFLE